MRRAGASPSTVVVVEDAVASPRGDRPRLGVTGSVPASPGARQRPSARDDLHVPDSPAERRVDGGAGTPAPAARRELRRRAARAARRRPEPTQLRPGRRSRRRATRARPRARRPLPPTSVSRRAEAHRLPQRVADAAHGVDQARLAVRLGLAAQVADVDVERVGARSRSRSPRRARRSSARVSTWRGLRMNSSSSANSVRVSSMRGRRRGHLRACSGRARRRRSAARPPAASSRRRSARSRARSSSSANGLAR